MNTEDISTLAEPDIITLGLHDPNDPTGEWPILGRGGCPMEVYLVLLLVGFSLGLIAALWIIFRQ